MSLIDRFRGLVTGDKTEESQPEPDALLELANVSVALEPLGYEPVQEAALCFDTEGAETTIEELQSVVTATTDQPVTVPRDDYGYQWLVFADESPEALASALQFASRTLVEDGYRDALLAAVMGFTGDQTVYVIYSFDRGRFYPFVPEGTDSRDSVEEFKLRGVLEDSVPVESEPEQWYPLWPDSPGSHPWQ